MMLNTKTARLLILNGYKPNYENRVTMLVALLIMIRKGHNPTIFSETAVKAVIGRLTN